MASALLWPMVEPRASICRFRLLSATVSSSISVSAPTPQRASASAHQEPTPPRAENGHVRAREPPHGRRAQQHLRTYEPLFHLRLQKSEGAFLPPRALFSAYLVLANQLTKPFTLTVVAATSSSSQAL